MAQGNFKVGLAWTVDMFLCLFVFLQCYHCKKGKGSPYSFTERRVLELVSVLGSQPAGDVSHKPGGRLPLLSARPAVTLATLKGAATSFAAWWTEARWVWTVCLRLLPYSVMAVIWTQAILCCHCSWWMKIYLSYILAKLADKPQYNYESFISAPTQPCNTRRLITKASATKIHSLLYLLWSANEDCNMP